MTVYSDLSPKQLQYDLESEIYSPLIPGSAIELLACIDSYTNQFPEAVRFFGGILRTHLDRHPLLEDWLLVVYYQFFWSRVDNALQWLEERLNELILLIGRANWALYFAEVAVRTDCATTNDLLDRLYDIYLEMYGALYLGRQGWKVEFISRSETDKKPDIKGSRNAEECVLECKFIHTSEKYESFSRRFNAMTYQYGQPKPPLVLIEQCKFPCSTAIKTLSPSKCLLVKRFNKKIYEDRAATHIATFGNSAFVYSYDLEAALVPLDVQYKFAIKQGEAFALFYLHRLLNEAALQLNKAEYATYEKKLFIGLQPDSLYLAPWNEPAIAHLKSMFIQEGVQEKISVIFSEDSGFSVRGYL